MEEHWPELLFTVVIAVLGYFMKRLADSVYDMPERLGRIEARIDGIENQLELVEDLQRTVRDHDHQIVAIQAVFAAKRKSRNGTYSDTGL